MCTTVEKEEKKSVLNDWNDNLKLSTTQGEMALISLITWQFPETAEARNTI